MAEECPHFLTIFYANSYQMTFHLGEHADNLRFAVSIGSAGSEDLIVLHGRPTENGQVLAIKKKASWFHPILPLRQWTPSKSLLARPTQGNEIRAMFKHAKGFKLVRMEAGGPGGGRGGKRRHREPGETSDGKEVVSVWATKKTLIPMIRSPLKFKLLGSGKTGELRRHFGHMALIMALDTWSFQVLKVHDNFSSLCPYCWHSKGNN
ncbi:hypothetical protein F4811DRAFT_555803 [Daldinia bambusicola]|nr:hypothetical protein F4811DRAFT_555803 [Daldinia bambusicola]